MNRTLLFVVSAFMLGGCASWMPTDWLPTGSISSSEPVSLRLESEPSGADARTATGQACRTPCALTVPATGDVTVTFSLAGHKPEVVPVRLLMPGDPRSNPDAVSTTQFNPNPVVASLDPLPVSPAAAKKKPAAKPRTAAKPAAASRPASAPAAAASTTAPGMIPGSVPTSPPPGSPWPPLQR